MSTLYGRERGGGGGGGGGNPDAAIIHETRVICVRIVSAAELTVKHEVALAGVYIERERRLRAFPPSIAYASSSMYIAAHLHASRSWPGAQRQRTTPA